MNEKKEKKLRRSIMTHDEWLKEKAKRTYVFTEFTGKPRKGNKVIFQTATGEVAMGIVDKRNGDDYEIKIGQETYKVGLQAIKPCQAVCAPDKINQYKEMKKHA